MPILSRARDIGRCRDIAWATDGTSPDAQTPIQPDAPIGITHCNWNPWPIQQEVDPAQAGSGRQTNNTHE